MNLPDLIAAVRRATGRSHHVDEIVRAAFDEIRAGLARDGEVSIYGFGRFVVRQRRPGVARNFTTGETMVVGSTQVKFVPAQRTRAAIGKRR